jgi:hypothetical protein
MIKSGAAPTAIAREQEQLDLAERLLDRIDQSVHRIESILTARARRQAEAAEENSRVRQIRAAEQAQLDKAAIERAHIDLSVQVARRYGMQ